MKENRLFSLDMLRGIDMIYLTVISGVLSQVFRATGMEKCHTFFCSHPWGGVTLYDLIMPLFIFMCGAAVPIALSRRLKDGKTNIDYWKHVLAESCCCGCSA
jgi:predicted acyltransferase